MRRLLVIDSSRGTQYVVGGDVAAIARKFVAAARTADAFKDSAANQRLQHRLEMARRQAMARSKALCRNRLTMRLHCNINHSGDSENSFAGKQRHAEEKRLRGKLFDVEVISYD